MVVPQNTERISLEFRIKIFVSLNHWICYSSVVSEIVSWREFYIRCYPVLSTSYQPHPSPCLVHSASVVQQQHVDPSKPRRNAKGGCSAVADTDWVARVHGVHDLSQGYKTRFLCGLLGANHVPLFQETRKLWAPFWATLAEHSPTSLQRSPHAAAPHLKIWEFCRDEYRRCMQLLNRCLTHFLRVSRSLTQFHSN